MTVDSGEDRSGARGARAPRRHGHARHAAVNALIVLMLAGMTQTALAHKLNLFAAADGRRIEGEVYFAGGGKAADVPVLIQNADGETLAELRTGAAGGFAYQAAAPVAHRIIARTPDGHRAQWRIGAEALAGAFETAGASGNPAQPAAAAAADAAAAGAAPPAGAQHGTPAGPALDPAVTAAIERAVARQVRPLREEAQAAREAVQFRDVLGGLGYILGLAGLGLWWRCRRARTGR